jgi:sulfatase modifying factor 1
MAMGLVMLIGLSTISYATIPSVRLEVDWALTAMRDTEEAYESFVEKYKGKTRSARGMEKVEAGDWEIVKRDTSQLALEEYLVEYPKGTFFDKAVLRLLDRKAYQPIQTPTRDVLQDYLKEKEKVDIPEQKRLQLDRIITPIDNRKKIQDQLKTQESPDLGIREKVETPREKVTEAVTSKSDLNKEGLKDAPIMNRVKEKKEEVIDRRTIPIPEMVFVKGGTFRMGCTEEQGEDCSDFAKPAHEVTVKDFFIGKYEVTNEEFAAFLNAKGNQIEGGIAWFQPSIYSMIEKAGQRFQAKQGFEKHPVTFVSWYGAVAYCEWLSEYTGKRYQLPSEAQWEYAARGGIKSKGFKFSGGDHLKEVGFYNENSTDIVFKVGGKKANELGVFDMSGNASEWCRDTWHSSYNGAPPNGSCWQEGVDENRRVTRGGSWYAKENFCRVSSRGRLDKSFRINNLGFRVARY